MGPVFDATLDGEDGAPVEARRGACGADGELVMGTGNRFGRVGVRFSRVEPRVEDVVSLVVAAPARACHT
jgi:citrate lyase subunit beta/citryl-CoA lyase